MVSGVKFCAIAAMDEARVIGCNNDLPWHLPEDMRRFKQLTTGHAVLMGRRTYESLPDKVRPLPGRLNLVLSSDPEQLELRNAPCFPSVDRLLEIVETGQLELPSQTVWVIGGAQVYAATSHIWDELYLTRVPGAHVGDTHFPPFEADFQLVDECSGEQCIFQHFVRN